MLIIVQLFGIFVVRPIPEKMKKIKKGPSDLFMKIIVVHMKTC